MKSIRLFLLFLCCSEPVFAIMPIYPTHILVVSYGRKAGDRATEVVDPYLNAFRKYCPYLPEIHFLDDLTPKELEKEKAKYPNGAFVIINSHGSNDDDTFKVGSDHSNSGEFHNGQAVLNSASDLAWGSKLWIGACHSGAACFKKGVCAGAECAASELASSELPVLQKLAPLYCSAQGNDSCELFNQVDKNHDGILTTSDVQSYLRQERKVTYEMYGNTSFDFETPCKARKNGRILSYSTHLTATLNYKQRGKDHLSDVDARALELQAERMKAFKEGKVEIETEGETVFRGPRPKEELEAMAHLATPYAREENVGSCTIPSKIGADERKVLLKELGRKLFKDWPTKCNVTQLLDSIEMPDGTKWKLYRERLEKLSKVEKQDNQDCDFSVDADVIAICEWDEDGVHFVRDRYSHPDTKTFFLENHFCSDRWQADHRPAESKPNHNSKEKPTKTRSKAKEMKKRTG